MTRSFALILAISVLALPCFAAEETGEEAAIKAAALDYLQGWYTGDAERMERALHPDLAKRVIRHDDDRDRDRVDGMSALTLVQYTRNGYGTKTPADERRADIEVLDVYGNAATVRAEARDFVDFLHIGKVNGEWKIINVLWVMKPKPDTE